MTTVRVCPGHQGTTKRQRHLLVAAMLLFGSSSVSLSCAKSPPLSTDGGGGAGGQGDGAVIAGTVTISAAAPVARSGTLGLNYWMWSPTFGDSITGTEADVSALAPRYLRVGGHNNDNNQPDPFNAAQIDKAVAYARAVGATPIVQVPLLADEAGMPPTASTAAAMVTYVNVSKGYGVTYFSIGNEPDLYPDQEQATRPGFTPAQFCAAARPFVAAMKAVDPAIKIVGPDLSWKYQVGNDWMTPILAGCGELFDVVSFHRYPFAPGAATAANAQADAPALRTVIASLRTMLRTAGYPDKPLALTETNITYDGAPEKSILDASPGTVAAALWTVDTLGTALGEGLWTTLLWSISEGWTLGLITPPPLDTRVQRPAYHAARAFAEHFGPTLLQVTAAPAGVRAYASRNAADDRTQIMVVNWNQTTQFLTFQVSNAGVQPARFNVPPRSFAAVELPDSGAPMGWIYGAAEWNAKAGPSALIPASTTIPIP